MNFPSAFHRLSRVFTGPSGWRSHVKGVWCARNLLGPRTLVTQANAGLDVPQTSIYRSPFAEPDREAWITQLDGTKIGLTTLSAFVFASPPRTDILHRVVVWQLARRRAGSASTKTRAEVSGSGRKIYRQKGSGKARHGDRKAPQFRHGGVAHGPKPRSYDYPLPMRVRKLGLRTVLSVKFAQGYLSVIDKLAASSMKTADLDSMLAKRGIGEHNTMLLVGGPELSVNVQEAALDHPHCQAMSCRGLNVYDVLTHHQLVLSLDAVRYIEDFLYAEERKRR